KYGLNGTMPALTNSSVGSSRMSEALGTTVWPLRSKCSRKRLMISWVCTAVFLAGSGEGGHGHGGRELVAARPARSRLGATRVAVAGLLLHLAGQLVLALAHAGPHVGPEGADGAGHLAHGVTEVLGDACGGGPEGHTSDFTRQHDAGGDADAPPEQPSHHRLPRLGRRFSLPAALARRALTPL